MTTLKLGVLDNLICLIEDWVSIKLCNGSLCFANNFRAEVNNTLQ